ncbi:uncharacterized protein [Typha angustifolia]|uniref:uncharacterized protein n=1 Tax=Typha angustifolia TaxID=59011 RepID=UPI003C2CF331
MNQIKPDSKIPFAEIHQGLPVLLEYRSDTDAWQSSPAPDQDPPQCVSPEDGIVYLNAVSWSNESIIVCAGPENKEPTSLQKTFPEGSDVDANCCFHVYGHGNAVVVRWTKISGGESARAKIVLGAELWVMGSKGREWELASRAPAEMVEKIKPYEAVIGCLEDRKGVVRLILMSRWKEWWDMTWLSNDRADGKWRWVPVADFGAKRLDMAGITLASSFPSPWLPTSGPRHVAN